MRVRWPVVLVCLLALAVPGTAVAEDPPFVDYTSLLLPALGTYDATSEDDCVAGRFQCVDKVIREMTRRFDRLVESCDHDLMFSLTYLRTTEEYLRAATTLGFFQDPTFVNHEDAVFANYYFRPFEAWHAGRRGEVPAAWRIAFDAAERKTVTGSGDLLLGVNAHINRDLPYVLAGIGLVKPDGSSRKPDHDKVNEFLNRVGDDLYAEIARRFDPTVDDGNLPAWLDDMLTFQAFPIMRENAWRNAERLVAARTSLERAQVEASIEESAAATARSIVAATASDASTTAARDAYCAAHHDD